MRSRRVSARRGPVRRKKMVKNQPRRRNITRRVNSVPSLGNLIAKGVRTLTSFLPGQEVIKPLTDFGLKLFGLGTKVTTAVTDNRLRVNADVVYCGLGGVMSITPMCVFSYSGHFPHVQNGTITSFYSQYATIRIQQLEIKAELVGPAQSRQGMWGIAFVPFKVATDGSSFYDSVGKKVPTLRSLMSVPGTKFGSGNVMSQNFRFKPGRDGRLGTPIPFDAEIGAIMLAFDDKSRSKYSDGFTDDFAVNVTLHGFGTLQRTQFNDASFSYKDKPKDWLEDVSQMIVTDTVSSRFPRGEITLGYPDATSKITVTEGIRHLVKIPAVFPDTLTEEQDEEGSPFMMVE